jgi:hypothetical protein
VSSAEKRRVSRTCIYFERIYFLNDDDVFARLIVDITDATPYRTEEVK